MPFLAGEIEPITTTPDEELSSIDQINYPALTKAWLKKPTYKAYKTLVVHRRTLQRLSTNLDLIVQEASDAVSKASDNVKKTLQTYLDACGSTATSPDPTTSPPIAGEVLKTITELQAFYFAEKFDAGTQCSSERGRAHAVFDKVNERVQQMERALVKKFGIHTVDDEGLPLDMQDVERVIDVMASIPGNEKL